MIVADEDCGANGRLGVCTLCRDVVPIESGRCGNSGGEPLHARRRERAQAWTQTKRHVVVALETPRVGFCRRCRLVVDLGYQAGRPVCMRRRWADRA